MTRKTNRSINDLIAGDKDLLRELMQIALQEILEAEMDDALGVSNATSKGPPPRHI